MKEKILKWALHILPCLVGLVGGWQHIAREEKPRPVQTGIVTAPSAYLPRYLTFYKPLAPDTPKTGIEDGINTTFPFHSSSPFPLLKLTPFLLSQHLLEEPIWLR